MALRVWGGLAVSGLRVFRARFMKALIGSRIQDFDGGVVVKAEEEVVVVAAVARSRSLFAPRFEHACFSLVLLHCRLGTIGA